MTMMANDAPIFALTEKQLAHFWTFVDKHGPSECWEWQGGLHQGGHSVGDDRYWYGVFSADAGGRRMHRAHRVSYFIEHGTLDEAKQIDHLCRNTKCVSNFGSSAAMKRAAHKVPFGWDGAEILAVILVVRKILQRSRGIRFTVPMTLNLIRWHTTILRAPWINGSARNHVHLARAYTICGHAIGFAEGIVHPGKLTPKEREVIRDHFIEDAPATAKMFDKPAPKPKRVKRAPSASDKLAKASAKVHEWTRSLALARRAAKLAQTKLSAAQRSERALLRVVENMPPAEMGDDALRARLRAKREAGEIKETSV